MDFLLLIFSHTKRRYLKVKKKFSHGELLRRYATTAVEILREEMTTRRNVCKHKALKEEEKKRQNLEYFFYFLFFPYEKQKRPEGALFYEDI